MKYGFLTPYSVKLNLLVKVYIKERNTKYPINLDLKQKELITKEIYQPIYESVVSSIELLSKKYFDHGDSRNGLGEGPILRIIPNSRKRLVWNKIDEELKNKIVSLETFFEETRKAEEELYNKIKDLYLSKTKNRNEAHRKKNMDNFNDVIYFLLHDSEKFDKNKLSKIAQLKSHLMKRYRKKRCQIGTYHLG